MQDTPYDEEYELTDYWATRMNDAYDYDPDSFLDEHREIIESYFLAVDKKLESLFCGNAQDEKEKRDYQVIEKKYFELIDKFKNDNEEDNFDPEDRYSEYI